MNSNASQNSSNTMKTFCKYSTYSLKYKDVFPHERREELTSGAEKTQARVVCANQRKMLFVSKTAATLVSEIFIFWWGTMLGELHTVMGKRQLFQN